ncbi:helix-turn-helix domain-containing protein [Tellurirhabdus bombi]|uniref:helix-turn-helix domain-containing protein n=1 Tax=Tellurirhabdus bombi TaxID=2907205 RepID=UPI001F3EF134|nr:helix-turn-helix domain-containing protein [Tellurirhabdus bombi]
MRCLQLNPDEIQQLRQIIQSPGVNQNLALRCRCVLLHSHGLTVTELMELFQVNRRTVYNWLNRFKQGGLDQLVDKPGRGKKQSLIPETILQGLNHRSQEVGLKQAYREISLHQPLSVSVDTIRRRLQSGLQK